MGLPGNPAKQEGSILSVSAPNRFLVILIILVITMTRNNRHASAARSNGLFFVYAAHFLRPLCGDSACLYCSPRTEHLLIYRIQSHTHPKRRKFCLKHAGQKSVKDKLPEQRKGPKRAGECWLKVQTHVWEQEARGSSPRTPTTFGRKTAFSGGFSAFFVLFLLLGAIAVWRWCKGQKSGGSMGEENR